MTHIALLRERCKYSICIKEPREAGGIKGIVKVCVVQHTFFLKEEIAFLPFICILRSFLKRI